MLLSLCQSGCVYWRMLITFERGVNIAVKIIMFINRYCNLLSESMLISYKIAHAFILVIGR